MNLVLTTKNIAGVGTFGELTINGELFCYTVEKEWKNNEPFVSCVPAGDYDLVLHNSPKYGSSYALVNENLGVTINGPSTRTHCLVHIANWPSEVTGCIGVGMAMHPTKWGVASSAKAMVKLMQLLDGKPAKLKIVRH
ncbi:conserved hypothetical protein [Vibrio chagasii]|nr:conserved hypothetical protein [Vibrio chagasii]CAH7304870.1 conserved hypothetical protein [Vibrio chagasii]